MDRLHQLAGHSESAEGLTRVYLSVEEKAAGELLIGWMKEAGMSADFDAVGNVVGRYEGMTPGLPAVVTGSHYDAVRNAGSYDGMLGVVLPISCVKIMHEAGERLPHAIEVIGFADEEGVRFQSTLLGSRAIAGTLAPETLNKKDSDGMTMAEALTAFGLDPARIADAAHRPEDVLAYVEVHIEQGPVLEQEGLPVGIVTSIAGANRFVVRVRGQAGHAGTVPMMLRRDAATAASEMVLEIEKRCQGIDGLVGTAGQLFVPDGATNVIPGAAEFTIDIRAGEDREREAAVGDVMKSIDAIADRRGVTVEVETSHEERSANCAAWLMNMLRESVARAGIVPRDLMSGAGHDAMAIADIADISMLFVRCGNGGISHHSDETMTAEDADISAAILLDFFRRFRPKTN
ncbi:MAG: allantoate amidohydrolase [Alphaproteobacteria bacterium]|nr:allantoate amidohydrolase [Alphaproteobacteria bacterium]